MFNTENGLYNAMLNCDFQKLQDEMAGATKLACITVDYTGTPLTTHSRCSEFCNAVRANPELKHLCEKCDSRGGLEAARLKKPYLYICHMNVVDVAIPIVYQNLYIGAVMCGQIRLPAGERAGVERIISEQSNVAFSDTSLALFDSLPVISMSDIEANVNLISYLTNYRLQTILNNADSDAILPKTQTFKRINKTASLIQPAINYINDNINTEIKLNTVAALCDVSPSYFSKLFKKVTGENLVVYVNRAKVEQGRRELLTTNKSVQNIAKDLGYEDSGYFIKVFKSVTGETPNAFRDKNSL